MQINAGDMDRQNSIVTVENPYAIMNGNYYLAGPEGQILPVQVSNQHITFYLEDLSAWEEIKFELVSTESKSNQKTAVRFNIDAVEFLDSGGNPVLQYRTGTDGLEDYDVDEIFLRDGYLHPVYSPAGRIITEQYTPGRPHQKGIWTGWYNTEWNGLKPDFWSQAERTGKVEAFSVNSIETGPVFGELQTIHHFNEKITENSTTILSDEWTVRFYNNLDDFERPMNVIDLDVVQTNISEHPFRLIEHVYGGVGFRGSDQWVGEEKMEFVTSEGENRAEAHFSKARWVGMSGEIDREPVSIIILGHPDNLRFPEAVFINQREPFFTFAPLQTGDLILNPGDQFRAKYRYITLDGNLPSSDEIENYWRDYANPVKATILNQE